MEVTDVGGVGAVDAIVHGWNSKDTVRFPLDLVKPEDRSKVDRSTYLSALSNVSTEQKVDLYFESVEIAPEPDADDGLQ